MSALRPDAARGMVRFHTLGDGKVHVAIRGRRKPKGAKCRLCKVGPCFVIVIEDTTPHCARAFANFFREAIRYAVQRDRAARGSVADKRRK